MNNRLALVTGGTRGIGEAISIALKNSGYTVIANYANNDEIAENFKIKHGINVEKWDVSNFEECKDKVREVENKYNHKIGILVNNAGITRDGVLHKTNLEKWNEVIKTNLDSCFNMCHAVLSSMREQSFGRIINISSINGLKGQFGQCNYGAAKAGIIGFSKSLALENAIKNVTVNVVAPGYIATDMMKTIPQDILDQIISQIPVGRLGKPEEIARVVKFLADEYSSFITGSVFSVNGGQYMH